METWLRVLLIVIGFVAIVVAIIIAYILDMETGAFEFPDCKTRFAPDMKAYIMGAHTIRKRKLAVHKSIAKRCLQSKIVVFF